MIIKSISFQNYRGFGAPTVLELDPRVTVLTGANDSGKSSLLDLLSSLMIHNNRRVSETDINEDSLRSLGINWKTSTDLVFRISMFRAHGEPSTIKIGGKPPGVGEDVQISGHLNETASEVFVSYGNNTASMPINLTTVISLNGESGVGDTINLSSMRPEEVSLMKLAFGPTWQPSMIQNLSAARLTREFRIASDTLNERVKSVFGPNRAFRFHLGMMSGSNSTVTLSLEDTHGGETAVGNRGTGFRKILSLWAALQEYDLKDHTYMFLYDEPETSLHADSQHFLRGLLDALAENSNVQVVYATHSPSMINPLRPEGIRLVERINQDGRALSRIVAKPYGDNFESVRMSLGITAVDSLLYATVTLVVEGATEALVLPLLLRRAAENQPGLLRLLENLTIVQGGGDSYEYMTRIVAAQGSKALVFLDGDKTNEVRIKDLTVPYVLLPAGVDFEQIVPTDLYFRALVEWCEELGGDSSHVDLPSFQAWVNAHESHGRMMFSKQVASWYQATTSYSLDKPAVMLRAVRALDSLDNLEHKGALDALATLLLTLL